MENCSIGGIGADTGIQLSAGSNLLISVDPNATWSAGSDQPCTRRSNANGLTDCYGQYSSDGLTANYGALVGKIGGGPYFVVGTNFNGRVNQAGLLRLYYWDSASIDNSGTIIARVEVQAAP